MTISTIETVKINPIFEVTKENKIYILISILSSIVGWIIFKNCYPSPFFTFDSYLYTYIAKKGYDVSLWPIGYSKFIKIITSISKYSNLLVSIQYFLFQLSLISFFITIKSTFNIKKKISALLFVFLFFNPVFIFTSNHILSDPIFISITIFWCCQLIWIVRTGNRHIIILHIITLLLSFTFRYNSLYYPFISIIALAICPIRIKYKLISVVLTIIVPLSFVIYTRSEFEKITGVKQYSYFSGWKLASNALYMYNHVYRKDSSEIPRKFKMLDSLSRSYFNKYQYTFLDLRYADYEPTFGSWFTIAGNSPLIEYMRYVKKDNLEYGDWSDLEVKNMGPLGPIYKDYGSYLIKMYPLYYIKYIIFPNSISYFYPFPENLINSYEPFTSLSNFRVELVKKTFNISTLIIPEKYIYFRTILFSCIPMLILIIHSIYFLLTLFFLIGAYNNRISKMQFSNWLLLNLVCLANFAFVVVIHTSTVRYEIFIMILEFTLITTMSNYVFQPLNLNTSKDLNR